MAFNNVAEGWNWFPSPTRRKKTTTTTSSCRCSRSPSSAASTKGEDKIGVTQQRKVIWRYDYFWPSRISTISAPAAATTMPALPPPFQPPGPAAWRYVPSPA